MQEGGATDWREVLQRHNAALLDDLSLSVSGEVAAAVARALAEERGRAAVHIAQACNEARGLHSESLNQSLRRLRQVGTEEQILELLNQSVAPCAERSVVLVFENNQARPVASRGLSDCPAFGIADAPAIVSAIESRDPVLALLTASQLSAGLADAFGEISSAAGPQRAYLFPITARDGIVAILVAAGPVVPATVELLCEAAGMKLETLLPVSLPVTVPASRPAPPKTSDLVQLTALPSATPGGALPVPAKLSWDELTPADQKLHLQAQRNARVRVAEMRLYHEEALRRGLAAGDLYAALQPRIDAARQEFLQTYLSKSPTMVDYLHLEILRSLAHDDDRLLGPDYPGPMV